MFISLIILLILQINQRIDAFTHWIVTENGRIEPKLDTHFYLRRPYDLLALLEQEKRRNDLDNLMDDLVKQRRRIDKKSLDASYPQIHDCDDFLKSLTLLSASNASERIDYRMTSKQYDKEPFCTHYSKLEFSVFAYDHLESVKNRNEGKISNCDGCLSNINVDLIRNQAIFALEKNSTSWLDYNLAFLYWWMKGDFSEAVECARRSLYYVPKAFKDIPLANLGLFLWISHSDDALLLLQTAIDHNPNEPRNYLLLSRLYLNLGVYDKGLKAMIKFKTLQDQDDKKHSTKSDFDVVKFVKCNLFNGVSDYFDTLQDILSDWHEYHSRQQRWLSLQERMLWEIAPQELNSQSNLGSKLKEPIDVSKHYCSSDSKSDIPNCDSTMNLVSNLQKVIKTFNEKSDDDDEVFEDIELSPPKYPTTMQPPQNLYFDDIKWPTRDECVEWNLPLTDTEQLDLPVFLPPENKGYPINKILSEFIDVSETTEHELPWYPPLCDASNTNLGSIQSSEYLRKHFLGYINNGNGDEAEIGQRIVTAKKKKSGPAWVLAVLSSMYWRIRENSKNALSCLDDVMLEPVPDIFSDVVLVSMSSMLQQTGSLDIALELAKQAFDVNYLEPSTNFLLAILHYQKNNPISAMHYLKNVLRVDPDYYDGEAEKLLKLWACRIKLGAYEKPDQKPEKHEHEMCSERDQSQTEGVICSPNGEQCKTAAIHCFRADHAAASIKPLLTQNCGKSLTQFLNSNEKKVDLSNDFDQLSHDFHMRIFFGDEYIPGSGGNQASQGDIYVSASMNPDQAQNHKVMFHVHDKSGTYTLSKSLCKEIISAGWVQQSSMFNILPTVRDVNIKPFLVGIKSTSSTKIKQPFCVDDGQPSSARLTKLIAKVLERKLPNIAEESLAKWLALMSGDQEADVRELGEKIGLALKENNTSWLLATAAAIYWRVLGNNNEAVICLRQALTYVPQDMEIIPLINLVNVLQKVGLLEEALVLTTIAVQSQPKQIPFFFTAGNIYTSLGDFEKAIFFYRLALTLDPNFEPARNRLQAILCTLLFDESGTLRDNLDILVN